MSKENNKGYLVQGMVLAAASMIARIIGLIYRIPLTAVLGDEGNSYYATANEIYSIILMISSFSIPLALSKLISERVHNGEMKNAQKIFKCALRFSILTGGVLSLITYFFAGFICKNIMNYELATNALQVLAPAIFIFAITGTLRGFFQGHSSMVPTAISQIIEQVINAVVTVWCAYIMMQYGTTLGKMKGNASLGPAWAAAGGTFGTVVSVTIALIFLMYVYNGYQRRMRRTLRNDTVSGRLSERTIYKALILTIVPIVLSTLVYNLSNVVDQGVFNYILKKQGYSEQEYGVIWGIYTGKFRTLMNVPLSLASCLAPSVVPSLTAAVMNRNHREAVVKVRDSVRLTMVITIPCAVGMFVLASPIMQLLFGDARNLTAGIMKAGTFMIILLALSTLTTGILQGLDQLKLPLINTTIAFIIHLIVLVVTLQKYQMNIYGVIIANIVFSAIVSILNAIAIKKCLGYRQETKRTFVIPTITSLCMGAVVWIVYQILSRIAGNAAATIVAILVGIPFYGAALVKFHGMREYEISKLPKGQALVSICKKLHLL